LTQLPLFDIIKPWKIKSKYRPKSAGAIANVIAAAAPVAAVPVKRKRLDFN